MIEKICSKCKEIKHIFCFKKVKQNKDGYNGRCIKCVQIIRKEYYLNNKEKCNNACRNYKKNNPDKIKAYSEKTKDKQREYREKNKEKIKIKNKKYSLLNKNKMNEYKRHYRKYKISHNNKLADRIRTRIIDALNGNRKSKSTMELLGCSIEFFKEYIESKFTKGMTWDLHTINGWHLDHIKPCSSFDLSDQEQQKLCFHYSNYQPLWATTEIATLYGEDITYLGNINKSDKILQDLLLGIR